jgi:ribosomal protein S18 acetylase RimI-like enzyme
VSIIVEKATIDDVGRIVLLFDAYRQFYGKTADMSLAREFLIERFRNRESVIFVATAKHETVGFAQLYPSFSSTRLARTYILNDLYVIPDARRLGVGRLLLEQAASFGRTVGAARLSLSTALSNIPAQKLYESLGWKRDQLFCEYGLAL